MILTLALGFGFYSSYYNHGLILSDEGSLIRPAQRILTGEVPYRDFYHFYAPGRFYLLALLFRLGGEKFLISRWMWVAVRSMVGGLVFLTAAEFLPVLPALLPAVVVISVPGPWFKSFYPFWGLVTFLGVNFYLKRPSHLRLIVLSFSLAAALFFRQDTGIYAGLLALAAIVLTAPPPRFRSALISAGIGFGVTAAFLSPYVAYMYLRGALGPMLRQLFGLAPGLPLTKSLQLGSIFSRRGGGGIFLLFFSPVPFQGNPVSGLPGQWAGSFPDLSGRLSSISSPGRPGRSLRRLLYFPPGRLLSAPLSGRPG